MQDLLSIVQSSPRADRLQNHLAGGGSAYVEGLWGSSAALLAAALAEGVGRVALCVLPQIEQADAFAEDVALFSPNLPMLFPAWETLAEEDVPEAEVLSQRLAVLKFLAARRDDSGAAPGGKLIVAPIQALLQRVPSTALLERNTLTLRQGTTMPLEKVFEWLLERGFRSVRMVEAPGEFSRRGGILDLYPYAGGAPVRIELFGDAVESIRSFDPATQSSVSELPQVTVTAVPRQAEAQQDSPECWSSLLDHLPKDSWLALKEPAEIMERGKGFSQESPGGLLPDGLLLFNTGHTRFPRLQMAALPGVFSGRPETFHVHSVERFGRDLETTVRELELSASERERTIVLCGNSGEKERLTELLAGSKLFEKKSFEIRIGRLNAGFDWTDLSLTLLTHHEIFHRYRERRAPARYRHTRAIDSFYDLQPGDYVVHATHGIGMFHGMELIERDGVREECLKIEYADKAFLYVPATHIELVQKYVGPSEHRPPVNKLGTQSWQLRKERAEEAAHDLAAELLRIQAIREATQGLVHSPDTEWQREFEDAFPYEETEDQLRVADEVKRDLERSRPMDRLICGDVGYGKTEIAMRAAVKVVFGGAQVAVLVPTTVLAAQHQRTFQERMADYPIRVEMLSRFLTPGEQQDVLDALAAGEVDIIIGTHRLIQPDVKFKNLGLVIIDEEQRFGVEHKERLKQLRATVDVLTLTATPIPRTLHMSILGLRDISSLDTPPRDRLAIHTRLMRADPQKIRQALLHELARDGQAFFVHNRVETIERMTEQLKELVPEARFLMGHGQMREHELAEVMREFVDHKADVLVCTTIIESGLDIPNANTILIDQADMFGLAELHQLRGRVGRYKHRAYAYMLLPEERPLTPVGEKRLKAIEEFSELGAGFRIAMRDLEIRGAGNILGPEQSGHIAAVGYDMYCRILERTVRGMKNEPVEERPDVSLSLGVEARLPEEYLPDPAQRIDMYRKLYRAQDLNDIETLRRELRDRYGPWPEPVAHLLTEARLRQLAQKAGIEGLQLRENLLVAKASDVARAMKVLSATGMICRRIDDTTINVRLARTRKADEHLLSFLVQAFERAFANLAARGMEA